MEYGVFEEYYYYARTKTSDEHIICSLLEWEVQPVFYAGIKGDFKYKNFRFSIKGDSKMPFRCGSMLDSDYSENGLKFNYSINESTIDKGFDLESSFSYLFDLSFFCIEPNLLIDWSYISINARNGYGWYGSWEYSSDGKTHSWDSPYSHYYPDEKYHLAGVDYKNHSLCFFTGFNISKTFFKKWENRIGFFLAPFSYIYAKDHHLGKEISNIYEDKIYNYFKNYKITLESNIALSKKLKLGIFSQFEYCLLTIGNDYWNGYKNNQDGGCAYNKIKLELCLTLLL